MSTKGTVYAAVNGVSAGVTSTEEAKLAILSHIRELLDELAGYLPVERLDELAARHGLAFEIKAGQLAGISFH